MRTKACVYSTLMPRTGFVLHLMEIEQIPILLNDLELSVDTGNYKKQLRVNEQTQVSFCLNYLLSHL